MKIIKWLLVIILTPTLLGGAYLATIRFKGEKEEISFHSDIPLKGLLLKPETAGPHPAILLLHGAGGNHQEYDKLFFKFHANAFVEKGFAVMVYSKRSEQDVDYKYFTYHDLLNDADSALQMLKQHPGIDHKRIGLMGISESGWFTPELVHRNPDIRFLINRVSSPFDVRKTVAHEVKSDAMSEGFSAEDVEQVILPLHQKIWQYYIDVHQGTGPALGPERNEINKSLKSLHENDHFGKWFQVPALSPYDSLLYAARSARYQYDPMPFLQKSQVPMLYIFGGKDKNIPTESAMTILKQLERENNLDLTLKLYPDASHYLYRFGLEDGPFEGWLYYDDYLDTMTEWVIEKSR